MSASMISVLRRFAPALLVAALVVGPLINTPASVADETTAYVKVSNRATGKVIDGMGRTADGANAGQYSSSDQFRPAVGDSNRPEPTSGSRTGPRACTWTAWAAPPAGLSAASGAAPPTTASNGRRKLPEPTSSSGTGRPGCTWTVPGGPTTAPTSSSTAQQHQQQPAVVGVRDDAAADRDQDRARREQHQGRQRQRSDVQGVRPAQCERHERAADGLQGPAPEQVRGAAPGLVRWTESRPDERESRDGQRSEQLHRAGSGHHAAWRAKRRTSSGLRDSSSRPTPRR